MPAFQQCRTDPEPDPDCAFCPRLLEFRNSLRSRQPEWHNAPVPSFGENGARLLVVGLAPGLRGANRTGRPFTGDFAGELLYETLIDFGFAAGSYQASCADGLRLVSCVITNAVRCVPPHNKPALAEINKCRAFLAATIAALSQLEVIVALGKIAHDSVLRAFDEKPARYPFAHGAEHVLSASSAAARLRVLGTKDVTVIDSYHCSRYNTQTGVLTRGMFRLVFAKAKERLQTA